VRQQFVAEIEKIVGAIEQIIEANRRLIALRGSLERDGVSTSSIGPGVFGVAGGAWSEEFPLPGYKHQGRKLFRS
jgi:hypothetical protein